MLSRFRKSLTGAAILSALAVFSIPAAQPASAPESKDPIIIGKLDWVGQEITAEVAGEILRRMGYNVQFLQTTIVPMFQAVADGQMTVYLEQWNQSSKKYYDEYIKNARIEDLGETGLTGAEGWYYPEYVEQKCPGLPEWTALKKCAGIFATPDTAPKGRFLDYPAEYTPDSRNGLKRLG